METPRLKNKQMKNNNLARADENKIFRIKYDYETLRVGCE